jgi:hypothetical protein
LDGVILRVVDLIQSIYVINEAGETLASVDLGEFHADEALFGGFMSAIDMFSHKMAGDALKELILGKHRLVVAREDSNLVVTIHDKADTEAQAVNRRVCEVFRKHFAGLVTDELLQAIRAAAGAQSARTRADEWASKML